MIIAGVVIVIIIWILVWFGVRRGEEGESGRGFLGLFPSAAPTGAPAPSAVHTPRGAEEVAGELPLTQESSRSLPTGTLLRLSADNTSSLVGVGTTSARYHKNIPENLGHLFERRTDGTDKEKRISNFTIPQVLRVVWAPDGKKAVIFYNLDNQIRKLLIDYSTTTPKTNFLPDTISDVDFSPDSRSLAFINSLGDLQNIFIATSDFRNQRKVFDNNIPNLEISWPAVNTIALKTKSSYAIRGFLYALNPSTGAFNKIAEGLGLDAVWNHDASGTLYSTSDIDGNLLNLKFVDTKTGEIKDLGVRTIAEKCAFLKTQKNLAYCAVPKVAPTQGSEQLSGMPDNWWQGKISFQDNFVLIDTETSKITNLAQTNSDVTIPKLPPDDSWLLFRDKTTSNLWSLKLKP